ncbi:MAG: response regulator [Hahellaceae bacterium]|nr:response regulator [Hahellaceae bacterium]
MALKTALVVDDSKLARITLQRLLEKHELTVHCAESGIQALDLLKDLSPDIIFMDHLMPELDGFETTQKIKGDPRLRHIPVIMCSGKEGVDNYEEQAVAIGASGILSKPPQPEKLQEVMIIAEKVLGQKDTLSTPAAPTVPVAAYASQSVLDDALARIERLENKPVSLPSFDGFQHQLQDNTARIASVESQATEFAQQFTGLSEECSSLETRFGGLDAKVESLTEIISALEKFRLEWEGKLQTLSDASSHPAVEPTPAIDEEALGGRVARDVENTLTPVFESELKALEARLNQALDEAISESRKDLDVSLAEQISRSVQSATPSEGALSESPSAEAVADHLRPHLAEIVVQTTTAAIDTRLEDMNSELKMQHSSLEVHLKQWVEAQLAAQNEAQQMPAPPSAPTPPPSGGGAMPLAVGAIVVAVIALARSFGLF